MRFCFRKVPCTYILSLLINFFPKARETPGVALKVYCAHSQYAAVCVSCWQMQWFSWTGNFGVPRERRTALAGPLTACPIARLTALTPFSRVSVPLMPYPYSAPCSSHKEHPCVMQRVDSNTDCNRSIRGQVHRAQCVRTSGVTSVRRRAHLRSTSTLP